MKRTKFTRITALCLAVLMLCGSFGISVSAASDGSASGSTAESLRELLNAESYTVYDAEHPTTRGQGEVLIDATDVYSYSDGKKTYYRDTEKDDTYYYLDEAGVRVDVSAADIGLKTDDGMGGILSPSSGTLTWNVTIPTTGRYAIAIEYYPLGDASASIERVLYIDGKVPFAQARYLSFSKIWAYNYQGTEDDPSFKQDINGNELRPSATAKSEWISADFTDANGFYQGAFEFYFDNKGSEPKTHTVALSATREAMAIKSVRIYAKSDMKTYADWYAQYQAAGYKPAGSTSFTSFEAEYPFRVSDTSVFAAHDRSSPANSPSSATSQPLNVLGSTSYDTIGQWASYRFTVEKDGLYTITVRAKQDKLAGMYTSRTLRLAGGIYGDELAVPFAEAYNCRFDYNKSWQMSTLSDGTNTFQFYFQAGVTYTMSLDVSLGSLAKIIEDVENSMQVINECYLEILKLTGTQPDEYRDYRFMRVMPETIRNLLLQSKELYRVSKELVDLSGSTGAHVATLDRIALLLQTMGENEGEKIAANLSNLKSYIGTLGTWLNTSKQQSLMMDYVIVAGVEGEEISTEPAVQLDGQFRADANFFEGAWFEITAFFSSFFTNYDQMGVTEESLSASGTRVEVWLATGRDQASIWRNLIDSSFTSTEAGQGNAVDLKLVSAGTLLPSVLANQGPDVYMGLDSGTVINYAIRSAIVPVTDFARNSTVLDDFAEELIVPLTMFDEIYGLPESAAYSMMFYRKDVLANLELDPPETWDDLLAYVPIFQASNMEIGFGRNYDLFLYQRGGDRWTYHGRDYDENGKYAELMKDPAFSSHFDYMQIAYGENIALDAFQYMCRFYTDYSFPVTFDAANRFRTGEMPIIITDAISMYNQLTVFATEVRGLWMFTDVPGTKQSNGTINRDSIANVTANVMMNGVSNKEAAWRFMAWMVSTDVQASYGNNMVSLVGPAAKYATANRQALANMSWTTEERTNLLHQYDNIASIPNYPGAYIIGRYLDFAFLNAYNDGMDAAEGLQGYILTINKEITRKRIEFELPTLEGEETVDDAVEAYLNELTKLSDEELSIYSEAVQNYVKSLR